MNTHTRLSLLSSSPPSGAAANTYFLVLSLRRQSRLPTGPETLFDPSPPTPAPPPPRGPLLQEGPSRLAREDIYFSFHSPRAALNGPAASVGARGGCIFSGVFSLPLSPTPRPTSGINFGLGFGEPRPRRCARLVLRVCESGTGRGTRPGRGEEKRRETSHGNRLPPPSSQKPHGPPPSTDAHLMILKRSNLDSMSRAVL